MSEALNTTSLNEAPLPTGQNERPEVVRGTLFVRVTRRCSRFWMHFAGLGPVGRFATRLATMFTTPYFGRTHLAEMNERGYVAPSASIDHHDVRFGRHVLIGDNVVIVCRPRGGTVEFGDKVHLYGDTNINTGEGGSIRIGDDSHIQQRCYFSAYLGRIDIGRRAEIAPNCAFYAHNHGIAPGTPIRDQPLSTKGGLVIEDDVWLGFGVIVLDGVRIGTGAVIAAGSVVTTNIPENAIASGNPARVIKFRQ